MSCVFVAVLSFFVLGMLGHVSTVQCTPPTPPTYFLPPIARLVPNYSPLDLSQAALLARWQAAGVDQTGLHRVREKVVATSRAVSGKSGKGALGAFCLESSFYDLGGQTNQNRSAQIQKGLHSYIPSLFFFACPWQAKTLERAYRDQTPPGWWVGGGGV